jgi:Vault protein inter-alpha-trypsin domain
MKKTFSISLACLSCAAGAQHLTSVYDRDTHDQFKLKHVDCKSVVKGPIVTQDAVFTFDNPEKKLTEASVWFDYDPSSILSTFGYWYKKEYVPGILMDKNKAWFIYTAITSRNEDPGIMVQTDTGSYHAQIFPLAQGYDFRVRLNSVGFLTPDKDGNLTVKPPSFNEDIYPATVVSADTESIRTDNTSTPPKTVVTYPQNPGMDLQVYAEKHKDGYTYVAGILRTDKPDAPLSVSGIHKVFWMRPQEGKTDGSVKYFVGRRKGSGPLKITCNAQDAKYVQEHFIKANDKGTDTAKLWAHQKLVQDQWQHSADVLKFSLAYQIPSSETALLAVPQEEMKIFKKKAAEYRRKQAEEARKHRGWENRRSQNNTMSSGGDPEIRVYLPDAKRAYAILPDGRQVELVKASNGYWGGNYDIPADAPEGEYQIKVVSVDTAGEHQQVLTYQVDRTPPTGTLKMDDGFLVLTSEKNLAKAVAVFGDGTEESMVETDPGIYKIPLEGRRVVKVVMIDRAHNVAEVQWSLTP